LFYTDLRSVLQFYQPVAQPIALPINTGFTICL